MKDHFLLAFSNLKRRGLRSWLTMIGIFIGIAAVVGLISLGQGLQGAINKQFEQLGKDKIIIQSKTMGPPGTATGKLILTTKDLNAIESVRGVERVVGILMKSSVIEFKDETKINFIIGINPKDAQIFSEMQDYKVIKGRDLRDGDGFKAVVGYNNLIDEKIWKRGVGIGSTITVGNVEFKIVGILGKTGDPYNDAAIYIPKDTLRNILNTQDEEDEIVVKTQEGFNPNDVAKSIERKLRQERDEKEGQETFTVQTSEQLLNSFTNIFNIVQGVLVGIAAISLLVGGIGIMNTMYTSVLERTKEIGTMKAVGAKNSDILQIFLFESGLLGLVGGIIGIGLGIGLGKGVQYIATIALGTNLLQASITLPLIFGALTFSFFIGTLSGILPAMQAAKLRPADALRYE
ncbi:MAG: ABC transporter permease [Candidatus Pacearchaeota archaeon]|nr:ABC transporter permease [Candidatus Pacearchaeota archaeon]